MGSFYLVDPEEFALVVAPETMKDLIGADAWGLAIIKGADVDYLLYPSVDGMAKVQRKVSQLPTTPAMPWSASVAIIDHVREMDLLAGLSEMFSVAYNSNERSSSVVPGFRPAAPLRQGDLAVKVMPFGIDVELTGDLAKAGWMAGHGGLTLHVSETDDRLALVRTNDGVQTTEIDTGLETCHSIPGVCSPLVTDEWIYPEYRMMGDAVVFRLEDTENAPATPSYDVELPPSYLPIANAPASSRLLWVSFKLLLLSILAVLALQFFPPLEAISVFG